MMKTNFIILAWALIVSCSVACKNDGFLDRFPQSAFSEPTFFNTEADLKLYANSFYDYLPAVTSYASDANSDNMVPRSINSLLANTYVVPESGGGWAAADWANIRQTNFFLDRYQRANTPNKEIYGAEVRFFRALFYWQKVVNFGDVPLLVKSLDDNSPELFGPRENRKKVMDFVLEDLNMAVAGLPEKGKQEAGRLSKDAALALKARICLWEGTFRKYHALGDENTFLTAAVEASSELINSGRYRVYSTGNTARDYFNLFIQTDLTGNSENIMHRAYIKGITTQNYSREANESNNGLSKDFTDQYLFIDGRPAGASQYTLDDTDPLKESSNRDPRYTQTIAVPGFVFQNATATSAALVAGLPAINSPRTTTGYWLIKGRSSDLEQVVAYQSDIDAFIFRYGEVLLNFAEAKYELNGTLSQADLDLSINKLRARVGMPSLSTSPVADPQALNYGYPVSPLLYEIRRERRIELVGEGFRFNDIKRWKAGKLIEGPKTIKGMRLTPELRAQYTTNVSSILVDANQLIVIYPNLTGNRVWNDKMYFYPIPVDQITLAGYTQNPGW